MSWRIIHISNESKLSLQQNNLSLKQGGEEYKISLEDIGVLLLENRGTVITGALLDACVQHKITVLVCDDKYMPSGTLLGYQQHSRQVSVIYKQLKWTDPFKKRLWQQIIVAKINNQYKVFKQNTDNDMVLLKSYTKSVQSGDATNREGVAARLYFQSILPEPLVRTEDNRINAALNYGYAIVRGVISRTLASYGFLTSFGIHHTSELNNFNLADDLIEPYRQFVDLFVFSNFSREGELTKEDRVSLINLLTEQVVIDGKKQTLQRAVEITVQSLVTATNKNDFSKLLLPTFPNKYE